MQVMQPGQKKISVRARACMPARRAAGGCAPSFVIYVRIFLVSSSTT